MEESINTEFKTNNISTTSTFTLNSGSISTIDTGLTDITAPFTNTSGLSGVAINGNLITTTGSGSSTTSPAYVPYTTYVTPPEVDKSTLQELLEDFKEEYQKASDYMDKLVLSMKEDKENLAIYNANFQYYVGMKMAYEKIIASLEKELEDENS